MITLALVGVGKWGSHYLNAVKDVSDCRIGYVCTRDYKKLIHASDIHGVIVATPAETHYEIARFFLQKSIPLLVEKPLVITYPDALRLQKLYEKSNSIVMTGHIYLHHPAFLKLTSLVPQLGRLQYIQFESGNFGPFRKHTSALWDWGPHDVSMCLALLDRDPVSLAVWGINPLSQRKEEADMMTMRIDFDDGVSVFVTTGRLLPEKKRKCTIVGSKGSVVFDDTAKQKLVMYKNNHTSYPTYGHDEPLVSQLKVFVEAIKNNQRQKKDFFLSLRVVKLLHAAEQSLLRNGKTIQIQK